MHTSHHGKAHEMYTTNLLEKALGGVHGQHVRGSLGLQSPKVLTAKLQPPRYDEVVTIDSLNTEDAGLPTYWQASRGDTLRR